MKQFCLLVCLSSPLVACGGSSDPDTDPTAVFRNDFERAIADVPFTASDTSVLEVSSSAVVSGTEDITVELSEDGRTLRLTVGSDVISLDRAGNGSFSGQAGDAEALVTLTQISAALPLGIAAVEFTQSTDSVSGSLPVGIETSAAFVTAETGVVTYDGRAELNAAQFKDGQLNVTPLGGDFELTANFDSDTVSGTILALQADPNDPTVDQSFDITIQLDLEMTPISGNSFSGQVTAPFGGFGSAARTLDNLEYSGNFYGNGGEGVAGTLTGSIAETGQSDIQLQGVFFGQDS